MRYVLATGGGASVLEELRAALPASRGWSAIPIGPALLLVDDPSRLLVLDRGRGAVLGHLFRTGPPSRRVYELDPASSDLIAGDAGRMGRSFWGGYVAVLPDARGGLVVRRDPSGGLPCLMAAGRGFALFASDPDTLAATGLWAPVVDVEAVLRRLRIGDLPDGDTALEGLSHVGAGTETSVLGSEVSTRAWWSPWDHVGRASASEGDAARLREVVANAVAACCAPHGRLLLGVSGGLDSSIVAACVPDASERVVCFTASTPDPHGDERRHARDVAGHLGLRLAEEWYPVAEEDLWRSSSAHSPDPAGCATVGAYARVQARLGAELGVDAFLTGHGGDNVFAFSRSASPVVDRWMAEGLGRGFLATVADVSAITGSGAVAVLRAAWRRSRAGGCYRWRLDDRYLSRDVTHRRPVSLMAHAWLAAPTGVPPGKAAHVASVLRGRMHVGGVLPPSRPPTLSPLLAQPVVECCLAMPAWRWCAGRQDRSVARAAFAPLLPTGIVARRSKGGPDGHAVTLFDRFRPAIARRLLGGRLAGAGMLDPASVGASLSGGCPADPADVYRLLTMLEAEAWMDHWSGRISGVDQSGGGG